jgi:hypothetical protein
MGKISMNKHITEVALSELHALDFHPFYVKDDEAIRTKKMKLNLHYPKTFLQLLSKPLDNSGVLHYNSSNAAVVRVSRDCLA